ncbi:MAG: hypothetical protein HC854_08595 [Flavobacterium sp.]|nr:hypothetical protein [Flavobacterium sp.]
MEVTLVDQKNCVTTNCDDKGKRMEFNIRPLVVPISELTSVLLTEYQLPEKYSKITFPRYNVPYKNIITATNVLDGFNKVHKDTFLTSTATAIKKVYNDFKSQLPQGINLTVLENSKAKIEATVEMYKESVNIQYVWDWIFDITETYNEIITFQEVNPSLCCVAEGLFPFHVVLGGNSADKTVYRTPFIKTLNGVEEENTKRKELTLLFEKLAAIISSFEIPKTNAIKVTPSSIGKLALTEKAIPFLL